MIELNNLSKNFDDINALNHVSVTIKENEVFGLVGTNGAGKSTTLRLIAGILRPDMGTVVIDDMPIYDNVTTKQRLFFVSEDPYFFTNANTKDMEEYFSMVYPNFDKEQFYKLLNDFEIDPKRKISAFSKGMKRQIAILLGICAKTKYLLCDESFDGLDPMMRQAVKKLLLKEMEERELTPVITSHNLRELEDICDHVGLLHKGGILLSKDMDDMKLSIHKVQCVYTGESKVSGLEIQSVEQKGQLYTYIVKGSKDEVCAAFDKVDTTYYELLPLSLEEIFICETEVAGYDVRKLIME